MITVSLCMIVKNEEATLGRCLRSAASVVDEIIIVDTGSTDRTKEIAYEFTPHVYDFTWIDDFSAARNEAYGHATMDYQMWLDADDVLPPEERKKLLELKTNIDPKTDIVTMLYHTHFDANNVPILTSCRERLTRREKKYRWQDPVHECIPLVGKVFNADITIEHRKPPSNDSSDRNLRIYRRLADSGKQMTPRQIYYFARELKDHGLFSEAAGQFMAFLDSGLGWQEDCVAACFEWARCLNALKQPEQAYQVLLRSFQYASPRAEICTEIGYYFKNKFQYAAAAEWFQTAANLPEPKQIGFLLRDYWGYIPNMELCVCAFNMGNLEEAHMFNERAAAFKPNDSGVAFNRRFFAKSIKNQAVKECKQMKNGA